MAWWCRRLNDIEDEYIADSIPVLLRKDLSRPTPPGARRVIALDAADDSRNGDGKWTK